VLTANGSGGGGGGGGGGGSGGGGDNHDNHDNHNGHDDDADETMLTPMLAMRLAFDRVGSERERAVARGDLVAGGSAVLQPRRDLRLMLPQLR
jgi:hypothetical protein